MTLTSRPATRTPEALAAAVVQYPDARRATLTTQTRPGRLIDAIIPMRWKDAVAAVPVRVLRCEVVDISAEWDSGDRGSNGYRLHLIVSATAAIETR